MNLLKVYIWPGNVRELKNVIERLCLLSLSEEIPISLSKEVLLEDRSNIDEILESLKTNFEEIKDQIKTSSQKVWITYIGERLDVLKDKELTENNQCNKEELSVKLKDREEELEGG